jgi:ankyrin repeat protein
MTESDLVDMCWWQKWKNARALITENPLLLCNSAPTFHLSIPAYWITSHGKLELLQHAVEALLLLHQRRYQNLHHQQMNREEEKRLLDKMLHDALERGDDDRWTPAHVAAERGRLDCMVFLVEHAPSGTVFLQVRDDAGRTPVYHAVACGHVDVLDFIVRHAPDGLGVLDTKDIFGQAPSRGLASTSNPLLKKNIEKCIGARVSMSSSLGLAKTIASAP